jgi:hypothetical protein
VESCCSYIIERCSNCRGYLVSNVMRDSRPCIVVTVLLNAVSTAEVSVKCNEGLQEQHVTLDSIIVRRPI